MFFLITYKLFRVPLKALQTFNKIVTYFSLALTLWSTTAATSRTQTCGLSWSTVVLAQSLTSSDCATRRCMFVFIYKKKYRKKKYTPGCSISRLTLVTFYLSTSADRRGDRHHPEVDSKGARVPSFHAKNPPGHQGRKHSAQHRGTRQTSWLWSRRTTHGNFNTPRPPLCYLFKPFDLCDSFFISAGYHGEEKHCDRHSILDGPGGHPGDRLQLCGWHLVVGHHVHWNGRRKAPLRWHPSHEGENEPCSGWLMLLLGHFRWEYYPNFFFPSRINIFSLALFCYCNQSKC